jgi:hypothetical protein
MRRRKARLRKQKKQADSDITRLDLYSTGSDATSVIMIFFVALPHGSQSAPPIS